MTTSGTLKPTREPLLEVSGLTREFTRRGTVFAAVDDVSFTVSEGMFLAIVGRSGNGKTTLLNMIAGLLDPTDGTVRIAGQDITELDDAHASALRNHTVGYVTQRETLLPSLDVWHNVLFPARMYKNADPQCEQRAQKYLQQLQIEELTDAYPHELSGGEIRRVALARTLVCAPKLLLVDEPTGDLDAQSTGLVLDLLEELARKGTAILMVSHDPEAIRRAHHTYRMDAGQLLTDLDK
ncbi:ABC transporter ATP-binding protein [Gleimia hominis]|uniref:ABC transporter ATP-binding protein n=1 Tax=Gleimia hominis TaxID=595468 RepID=A0ABU3I7Z8_9ACTO|nr:ABC transporter ATP-binding protein [Gleimia hominis]MDT3766502.1 ABC transporter ATP-binding protein [Gleimia hominis]